MSAATKARPAQFDRLSQHRRAMTAKVQIARKQLAMDEDDYRQIVTDESGQRSLAACTDRQLESVLNRMKGLGFKPLPKKGSQAGAQHPMAKKARALWISLHHLGVIENPSEQALEAFAKRQLNCERLVWARQSDAYRLIEALKAMAKRNGWSQFSPATGQRLSTRELQHHLCEVILGKLKAGAAVPADWSIDIAAFRLCGIDTAGTEGGYSPEAYARLAAALGAKLRDAKLARWQQ